MRWATIHQELLLHTKKSTWRCRQAPYFATEFVRREWTPAFKPHHVKVGNQYFLGCPGTPVYL